MPTKAPTSPAVKEANLAAVLAEGRALALRTAQRAGLGGKFADGALNRPQARKLMRDLRIAAEADFRARTEALVAGKVSLAGWEKGLRSAMLAADAAAVHLIHRGAPLGPEQEKAFRKAANVQAGYLKAFKEDLAGGQLLLGKQAVARAGLYGAATWSVAGRVEREANGYTGEERRVLGPADHCNGCLSEASKGWVPSGSLRGIGECECRGRCACHFEYRKIAKGLEIKVPGGGSGSGTGGGTGGGRTPGGGRSLEEILGGLNADSRKAELQSGQARRTIAANVERARAIKAAGGKGLIIRDPNPFIRLLPPPPPPKVLAPPPKPKPPPPPPKPETPAEKRARRLDEARAAQREAVAKAKVEAGAGPPPVDRIALQIESSRLDSEKITIRADRKDFEFDLQFTRDRIVEAQDKLLDLRLSKSERIQVEAIITVLRPKWESLRDKVQGADSKLQAISDRQSEIRAILRNPMDPSKVRAAEYDALRKKYPDLIPPGPIQERIKNYALGDAKAAAILEVASEIQAKEAALRVENNKTQDRVFSLYREVSDLERIHGTSLPPPIEAQKQQIVGRIVEAEKEWNKVREALADIKKEQVRAVAGVLAHGIEATPVKHEPLPKGSKFYHSEKLGPPGTELSARIEEAKAWLGKVVARSDAPVIEAKIGQASGVARAHYSASDGYIQANSMTSTAVIIHEYGHTLEEHLKTGSEKLFAKADEFLKYRVGNEAPSSLKKLFPNSNYKADETGRADKFGEVFTGSSAYYVGKEYSGATEVVSMGIQKLYDDPVKFIKKDREYALWIMGILDGSLR